MCSAPAKWITAGGNCNTATCKTAYWSGAPLNDFNDGTDFLVKQLKLKKVPGELVQSGRRSVKGIVSDVSGNGARQPRRQGCVRG
jgi:hypothetical protein